MASRKRKVDAGQSAPGAGKAAEAGPLLVAGYEGLNRANHAIPNLTVYSLHGPTKNVRDKLMTEAIQRLIGLAWAMNKPGDVIKLDGRVAPYCTAEAGQDAGETRAGETRSPKYGDGKGEETGEAVRRTSRCGTAGTGAPFSWLPAPRSPLPALCPKNAAGEAQQPSSSSPARHPPSGRSARSDDDLFYYTADQRSRKDNPEMFLNRYRLGVGLTTLVVSALCLPAAFGQVVEMPTISGGWADGRGPRSSDRRHHGGRPASTTRLFRCLRRFLQRLGRRNRPDLRLQRGHELA